MNRSGPFTNLRFDVRPRAIPPRILTVAAAFAVFTALWLIVPHGALYWLLLPLILALAWAASYGWRTAVANLVWLLQFLLER